jgi:hypothetical protein
MGMLAHGTQVTIDSVPIAGLRSIEGPQEEKDLVDVTDHDSGGAREYVPGLRDGGTLDLELLTESTDPGQQDLYANYALGNSIVPATFEISVPADAALTGSAFTITFDGFATSRSRSMPYDDVASETYSLKVTGDPVHSLVTV